MFKPFALALTEHNTILPYSSVISLVHEKANFLQIHFILIIHKCCMLFGTLGAIGDSKSTVEVFFVSTVDLESLSLLSDLVKKNRLVPRVAVLGQCGPLEVFYKLMNSSNFYMIRNI